MQNILVSISIFESIEATIMYMHISAFYDNVVTGEFRSGYLCIAHTKMAINEKYWRLCYWGLNKSLKTNLLDG